MEEVNSGLKNNTAGLNLLHTTEDIEKERNILTDKINQAIQ